jgi:hypothetical protein
MRYLLGCTEKNFDKSGQIISRPRFEDGTFQNRTSIATLSAKTSDKFSTNRYIFINVLSDNYECII